MRDIGVHISTDDHSDSATRVSLDDLVIRVRRLTADRTRTILGIVGAPGAGKSTLAQALADRLESSAAVVGMDGFHLAQAELERLGRTDRKGAPDTFDAFGYVALLRRLRANLEPVIYAPLFRRDLEEPIANCVPVPCQVTCVITEGNYLLLDDDGWRSAREELHEVWFVDVPRELRHLRLTRRRMSLGFTTAEARRWTTGSDERNAERVSATRQRADLILEVSSPVL